MSPESSESDATLTSRVIRHIRSLQIFALAFGQKAFHLGVTAKQET